MKKVGYWLSNIFGKSDDYCKGFCPSCKYYEICRADKSIEENNE